ncbi:DUF3298 and DUF4163 domain-containing protein [Listeria seeligeri]|uniref:DUF3298 and DUF4163 domain-containing protein n=1 Tax=Listeria seeligeri TaxID=1640 RepID=UPI0016236DE3|nr:DUF3298 and DUF4163 domain-containing protein [Listeria seeligeri]MBC1734656.1 DUF3298 and DUF4163 domain-containing protein [Listeria seeligeri]MBF2365767.1 DUF3298 domain-containing protein [Listeria seeligeri]MBF2384320.1 DUF3298 domain-containing protein [Listeria seeligeri]MBF2458959.1 DUF3298 domain-containing protein [Listeria seeligeri]MBF2539402.1 DUF3298 domain-containing protein [Listeria seeligeri]
MNKLRQDYKNTPIPDKLDKVVQDSLHKTRHKKFFSVKRSVLTTAMIGIAIFIITIATNTAVANAMLQVPIVKNIVQVFVGKEYEEKTAKTELKLKIPQINGLKQEELQRLINKSYIATGGQLLEEYKASVKNGDEHVQISSDFEEIVNTDDILTIRLTTEKTRGSSYTENHYLTLDKENQKILKLHDLFKDDHYLKLIQDNIVSQMNTQMKADPNKIYWDINELEPSFTAKNLDDHFYINKQNKLVISFNEYEVAPGYMGVSEFEIPTDIIQKSLKNNHFIE